MFRTAGGWAGEVLPPYSELVRFDAGSPLEGESLNDAASTLLRRHLAKRPSDNPFERFGERLTEELPTLLDGGLDDYHAYAFATVRMAGAAFELAASHVDWLLGREAEPAVDAMGEIVDGCKTLSFRLARRRAFDPRPYVAGLADAWDRAMDILIAQTG